VRRSVTLVAETDRQHPQFSCVFYPLPTSSFPLEFVPGRDRLVPSQQTIAGCALFDARTGEHVLSTACAPVRGQMEG